MKRTLAAIVFLFTVFVQPASAAAPYTCQWTVNNGTTPKTAVIRCTNGYARAYVWSSRYGRWVPVSTVPAGR